MAMNAAQWNRLQQDLPTEDRITYAEYLATINDLETIANNPESITTVTQNLTDAANAARNAAKDADNAETRKLLAEADAAAAEADRLVKEAEAAQAIANNPVVIPTGDATFKAIEDAANADYARTAAAAKAAQDAANGIRSNFVNGKIMGPSQFSKDGKLIEFQPMDEAARMTIMGYNPKTGKAYTEEESRALNGGYLPVNYVGVEGYRFNPETKQLEILNAAGMTSTIGARYKISATGKIVPDMAASNAQRVAMGAQPYPDWVQFDDNGVPIDFSKPVPGETIEQQVKRLKVFGQGVIFRDGKAIQYDASGKFYIDGVTPMPEGFGQTVPTAQVPTGVNSNIGVVGAKNVTTTNALTLPTGVTVSTTYVDQKTGNTVAVLSNGTTQILTQGTTLQTQRESVIATLTDRFNKYGLGSLATKIRDLAVDGATESTVTLQLMETQEYQTRFSANADRLKKGIQVLDPGTYLKLEDGYRQVLRSYGLKAFDNDAYVKQFISNDVSAAELSNRVVTAVQRVQNADPAVSRQLRDYYGIGQNDLVAYVLDPEQQFQKIERQVAAAEIGVAAARQGLSAGVSVAEQLAAQGISQAEAQKGYATIADILPTAEKLSGIYGGTMGTYGQSEGEQEVFNSLASAQRKRQRLSATEAATFGASSGMNRVSLSSERTAGQI